MQRRRFLATVAAGTVTATAGCSAVPGFGSDPELAPDEIATLTHEKVNERRRNHDVSELAYDEALEDIAAAHSKDMAERDYFSHEDPEGHKWAHRYEEAGYDCTIERGDGKTITGGENIYQIIFSDRSFTNEEIASRTVKGWMNSPDHRTNMLQEYWRREGIGVYIEQTDDETTVNVTQNFC